MTSFWSKVGQVTGITDAISFVKEHPVATAVMTGGVSAVTSMPSLLTKGASIIGSGIVKAYQSFPKLTTTAVIASPVLAGAIAENPKSVLSIPGKTASAEFNIGKNVTKLATNPSYENAVNIFKENPVASTVIAGASLGLIGFGGATLFSNYLNTKAVKENTKIMKEADFKTLPDVKVPQVITNTVPIPNTPIVNSPIAVDNPPLVTPTATKVLNTQKKTKKKYGKSSKRKRNTRTRKRLKTIPKRTKAKRKTNRSKKSRSRYAKSKKKRPKKIKR